MFDGRKCDAYNSQLEKGRVLVRASAKTKAKVLNE
jgi:hypothetical protein